MKGYKTLVRSAAIGVALFAGVSQGVFAATEIQFWHAMEAALGERVNQIAADFNASQSDYKIVPAYKGSYDQTLAAGIAAYRSGNAPAILQVYEVGTATMMQAKKAIVPVTEVFKQAGVPLDQSAFVPTIASYYSDAKTGELVSMPFNSSTPVLYYNKDAFKKAGLDASQPPKTWDEVAADAAKLKASGMSCGFTTGWQDGSSSKTTARGMDCRSRPAITVSTVLTPSSSSTARSRSRTSHFCRRWPRTAPSRMRAARTKRCRSSTAAIAGF
jgi:sn-glycerol 3-phosphate transport system substrate-binding protein